MDKLITVCHDWAMCHGLHVCRSCDMTYQMAECYNLHVWKQCAMPYMCVGYIHLYMYVHVLLSQILVEQQFMKNSVNVYLSLERMLSSNYMYVQSLQTLKYKGAFLGNTPANSVWYLYRYIHVALCISIANSCKIIPCPLRRSVVHL